MDPTLSEIRLFAGNFAPLSWAFCNGALLSIAENTALFSLIGTMYGGDGQVTFALPDLRSRVAVGTGQGGGLSPWDLGQESGTESVTLISTNMPAHNHTAVLTVTPPCNTGGGNTPSPAGAFFAASPTDLYTSSFNAPMGGAPFSITLSATGGSQGHENRMPYLALNYIIAVEGIYPSRN
jgi:microcystin-dependent protein